MSREWCFCGVEQLETEVVSYCVSGEPVCTRACYNFAMQQLQPVEKDGFHLNYETRETVQ